MGVSKYSLRDYLDSLSSEESKDHVRMLLRIHASGATYRSLANMFGHTPSQYAGLLRAHRSYYQREVENNLAKLKDSLCKVDPSYTVATNPETALQNMCAMYIGREMMKDALNELANLPDAKTK